MTDLQELYTVPPNSPWIVYVLLFSGRFLNLLPSRLWEFIRQPLHSKRDLSSEDLDSGWPKAFVRHVWTFVSLCFFFRWIFRNEFFDSYLVFFWIDSKDRFFLKTDKTIFDYKHVCSAGFLFFFFTEVPFD